MGVMVKKVVTNIADIIVDSKKFLLAIHESPDGDAIGSMLALGIMLKLMGKDITMYSVDVIPMRHRFLPYWKDVISDTSVLESCMFDVFVMLDCGDRNRSGDYITGYKSYRKLINIDHHVSNDGFGDLNYVDMNASCVGEQIYFLVKELADRAGTADIPEDVATCLLTAIYDDTGGMRYISTTSKTLNVAADLVDYGANCAYIAENLFFNVSRQKMELTGRVLPTLAFENSGRVAYLFMRQADLEATGAFHEDSEGLIDFPRSISGVEVAFLIKEIGTDKFKLSFRSRGRVDVNKFCSQFGGGGHKVAAGCTIEGNFEDVKSLVLSKLKELFK